MIRNEQWPLSILDHHPFTLFEFAEKQGKLVEEVESVYYDALKHHFFHMYNEECPTSLSKESVESQSFASFGDEQAYKKFWSKVSHCFNKKTNGYKDNFKYKRERETDIMMSQSYICKFGLKGRHKDSAGTRRVCKFKFKITKLRNNSYEIRSLKLAPGHVDSHNCHHCHESESIFQHRVSADLKTTAVQLFNSGVDRKQVWNQIKRSYNEAGDYMYVYNLGKKYKSNEYLQNIPPPPDLGANSNNPNPFFETGEWLKNTFWESEEMGPARNLLGELKVYPIHALNEHHLIFYGLLITTDKQMEHLRWNHSLVSMDATHDMCQGYERDGKMNDIRISTLMTKKEGYGKWLPVAEILLEREFGALYTNALNKLKQLVPQFNTRFWMLDPSLIEAKGIRNAFPTTQLSIFWCAIHINRKWKCLARYGNIRKLLMKLLYHKSILGHNETLGLLYDEYEQILPTLTNESRRKFKGKVDFWLNNIDYWAGYKRAYYLITQQVKTTNTNEGLHKDYKNDSTKAARKSWSPGLGLGRVLKVVYNRYERFNQYEVKAQTKKNILQNWFNDFNLFPFEVQELISKEYKKAKEMMNEGQDLYFEKPTQLYCNFPSCEAYSVYCIPCKHIFFWDLFNRNEAAILQDNGDDHDDDDDDDEEELEFHNDRILTAETWNRYLVAFQETGRHPYYVTVREDNPNAMVIDEERRVRDNFNEIHELFRADFYYIRQQVDDGNMQNVLGTGFVDLLTKYKSYHTQFFLNSLNNNRLPRVLDNASRTHFDTVISQAFESYSQYLDSLQENLENLTIP